MEVNKLSKIQGCLIGGAIGDALGWPVEFLKYNQILEKYNGEIKDFCYKTDDYAEITDDTQMTLYTAEGLLRYWPVMHDCGYNEYMITKIIYESYMRWGHGQGIRRYDAKFKRANEIKTRLDQIPALKQDRAPENTCINSLRGGKMGNIHIPINNSSGCGGVMRVAPVGLFFEDPEKAFHIGMASAAITHGNPNAFIPSGILASITSLLIKGNPLINSIIESVFIARKNIKDKIHALNTTENIILTAINKVFEDNDSDPQNISQLGEGWVGHEALAIALYCAIKYQHNFENAVIASVNHDGDSDSTGAITGNILGTYLGIEAIRRDWVTNVEASEDILAIAKDIYNQDIDEIKAKYGG